MALPDTSDPTCPLEVRHGPMKLTRRRADFACEHLHSLTGVDAYSRVEALTKRSDLLGVAPIAGCSPLRLGGSGSVRSHDASPVLERPFHGLLCHTVAAINMRPDQLLDALRQLLVTRRRLHERRISRRRRRSQPTP